MSGHCPDNILVVGGRHGCCQTQDRANRHSNDACDEGHAAAGRRRRGENRQLLLLDAGLVAAEQTLADRRSFTLDEKKWRAFQAALDRPVKTKKRLAALLTQPGALD